MGGILAGADLIKAAKLNKIISEREQIMTAMNTFYLKYNCIPGDCYNISTYLSGETNGDGDDLIEYGAVAGATSESYQAWKQLSAAGLYPGTYTGLSGAGNPWHSVLGTNVPASKAIAKAGYTLYSYPTRSGVAGYWDGNYGNFIWFGKEVDTTVTYGSALKPVDAYNIDKKIDDGIPGIGKTRTLHPTVGSCETSGSTITAPASSAYYITNDNIACNFIFLLDW